jgi:hypothetical protein
MKTIKTFNNASVVSVVNGRITLRVNDSELHTFFDASVVSISNGTVKIKYAEPLTEDTLKAGRIVEQRNGIRKLVLKNQCGHAVLIGVDSWASAPLSLDGEYKIIKVYEGCAEGIFGEMLRCPGELIWSEQD